MLKTYQTYHFSDARSLSEIADESVSLVVTSPPYPMIEMWDSVFSAQCDVTRDALVRNKGEAAFEAMHQILDAVWEECFRVLIPGGFACINIGDAARKLGDSFKIYSNHSRILSKCADIGFDVLPLILWRKQLNAPNKFMGSGTLPAGAYVTLEHEYILIFRKGEKRRFCTREEKLSRQQSAFFWEERNIWFSDMWNFKGIRQKINGRETRERSAAFPLELAYRLVNMYSLQGEVVLDPFAGTGTSGLACIAAGRNFIGYEIDDSLSHEVTSAVKRFSTVVNELISERLLNHVAFIRQYERDKRKLNYWNRVHNFSVVTRHETQLTVPFVNRISLAESRTETEYILQGDNFSPPSVTINNPADPLEACSPSQ